MITMKVTTLDVETVEQKHIADLDEVCLTNGKQTLRITATEHGFTIQSPTGPIAIFPGASNVVDIRNGRMST